jgi:hypothetical protein
MVVQQQRKGKTVKDSVVSNKYGARCAVCAGWVEPGAGTASRRRDEVRWVVAHNVCLPADQVAPPPPPPSVDDDEDFDDDDEDFDDDEFDDEDDEDDEDVDPDDLVGFNTKDAPAALNAWEQAAWQEFADAFKAFAGIVLAVRLPPAEEAAQKPAVLKLALSQLPAETQKALRQGALLERFTRLLLAFGDKSLAQIVEML